MDRPSPVGRILRAIYWGVIFYRMRQGAFVLEDLREVATVDPASAGGTVDEMLGLILGRIADASSDVLAARNLCHCYCVVGNTVSWPVCKFLTATLL